MMIPYALQSAEFVTWATMSGASMEEESLFLTTSPMVESGLTASTTKSPEAKKPRAALALSAELFESMRKVHRHRQVAVPPTTTACITLNFAAPPSPPPPRRGRTPATYPMLVIHPAKLARTKNGSLTARPYASQEVAETAMNARGRGLRSPSEDKRTAFSTAAAGERTTAIEVNVPKRGATVFMALRMVVESPSVVLSSPPLTRMPRDGSTPDSPIVAIPEKRPGEFGTITWVGEIFLIAETKGKATMTDSFIMAIVRAAIVD